MQRRMMLVLAMLVGSVLVYCSHGVQSMLDGGPAEGGLQDAVVPDAVAQQPTPCAQWEVRTITPPLTRAVQVPEEGTTPITAWVFDPFTLEPGWEPFGGDFSRGPTIALRRCKSP